jgi:hypothetical protein
LLENPFAVVVMNYFCENVWDRSSIQTADIQNERTQGLT